MNIVLMTHEQSSHNHFQANMAPPPPPEALGITLTRGHWKRSAVRKLLFFRCASISWFEVVSHWLILFQICSKSSNDVIDVIDVIDVGVMWGWCDVMWCDVMQCDAMWCDVMWCDVMWCVGTSIHAMSMISHEISWWDISVVQVKQEHLRGHF